MSLLRTLGHAWLVFLWIRQVPDPWDRVEANLIVAIGNIAFAIVNIGILIVRRVMA